MILRMSNRKAFRLLVGENLFVEVNKRYSPTERFQAIVEHYFEEDRGQIYDSLSNMTFEKEKEQI